MEKNFAFLSKMLPRIRWDVKYTTWNNFTGKPVDGYMVSRIAGMKELGAALHKTQRATEKLGYGLFLWDGYRPRCTADCFLSWASLSESNLTEKCYYPDIKQGEVVAKGYVASQSSHNRGGVIDLTIFRLGTGILVPMGGDFDFIDVWSHHAASGLNEEGINSRESLRAITERGRFEAYRYE